MREVAVGVAQEGAFALRAPELLEEREDLQVRELLERLVACHLGLRRR